jgi:hypothetical protein
MSSTKNERCDTFFAFMRKKGVEKAGGPLFGHIYVARQDKHEESGQ